MRWSDAALKGTLGSGGLGVLAVWIEAVEPILNVVRSPYPFPDPTSQVSGKHFARSKFVRWRGYLCIALGKLGGEAARRGLEQLAVDLNGAAATHGLTLGGKEWLRMFRALLPKVLAEGEVPVLDDTKIAGLLAA